MLQELAARTGATAWAIASMLFFIAAWLVIAVRVFRARPEELEARARLVFEGDEGGTPGLKGPGLRGRKGPGLRQHPGPERPGAPRSWQRPRPEHRPFRPEHRPFQGR